MTASDRRIDLRFGEVAVSLQGFDDPVQPMKQVLRFVQRVVEESPEISRRPVALGDEEIEALLGDLSARTGVARDEIDATPGLVVTALTSAGAGVAVDREAGQAGEAAAAPAPSGPRVPIAGSEIAQPTDGRTVDPITMARGGRPEPVAPVVVAPVMPTLAKDTSDELPQEADPVESDAGLEVVAGPAAIEEEIPPIAEAVVDQTVLEEGVDPEPLEDAVEAVPAETGPTEMANDGLLEHDAPEFANTDIAVVAEEPAAEEREEEPPLPASLLASIGQPQDERTADLEDAEPESSSDRQEAEPTAFPMSLFKTPEDPSDLRDGEQLEADGPLEEASTAEDTTPAAELAEEAHGDVDAQTEPVPLSIFAPAPEENSAAVVANAEGTEESVPEPVAEAAQEQEPERVAQVAPLSIFAPAAEAPPAAMESAAEADPAAVAQFAPQPAEERALETAAVPSGDRQDDAPINIFASAAPLQSVSPPAAAAPSVGDPADGSAGSADEGPGLSEIRSRLFGGSAPEPVDTPGARGPRWIDDPNEPGAGAGSPLGSVVSRYNAQDGDGADAMCGGASAELSPTELAERAGAGTVPELLCASAAWLTLAEKRSSFGRREVMEVFDRIPGDHPRTLEARIKGFGKLVRSGSVVLVDDGRFALSSDEKTRYRELFG